MRRENLSTDALKNRIFFIVLQIWVAKQYYIETVFVMPENKS